MATNHRFCLTGTCPGVNDYCDTEADDEHLDPLLIDIRKTGVPCKAPRHEPVEEVKAVED